MLFYAALTVAGVVAAAIVVWVARSMMVAGKSAYRTLSPATRSGKEARLAHLNNNLAASPAPWGWSSQNGAPAGSKVDRMRPGREPITRSKSKDWSELELYQRSYEKAARDRDGSSPTAKSVRNVLAGYDMTRPTSPDTSSWPYQSTFKPELSPSAGPEQASDAPSEPVTEAGERPTKPWGW